MKRKVYTFSPGRAAIVGNPSDIYAGATIALTFKDYGSFVCIEPSDYLKIKSKIVKPTDVTIEEKDSLEMALLFTLRMKYPTKITVRPKIKITDDSNLPYESGLARSTGTEDALLDGIIEYFELNITDPRERAEINWAAEWSQGICGGQERYAIAFDDHELSRDIIRRFLKKGHKFKQISHVKPGKLYFMDFKKRGCFNERGEYAKVEELYLSKHLPLVVFYPLRKKQKNDKKKSFDYHQALYQEYEKNPYKIKKEMNKLGDIARAAKKILKNGVDLEALGKAMTDSIKSRKKIFEKYAGVDATIHVQPIIDILNQSHIKDHVLGYNMPGSKSLIVLSDNPKKLAEKVVNHDFGAMTIY